MRRDGSSTRCSNRRRYVFATAPRALDAPAEPGYIFCRNAFRSCRPSNPMKPCALIFPLLLILAGAQSAYGGDRATAAAASAPVLLQGRFDNREQAQASAEAGAENPPLPHVVVIIEPTQQAGWSLWRMHLEADAENSLDAIWAMQTRVEGDGSKALIPYYQLKPTAPPAADAFDAQTWLS